MNTTVIPAKAGTQSLHDRSGEASQHRARLGPGLRRDDDSVLAALLRVSAPPRESNSMLGCARTLGHLFTRGRGDAEGGVSSWV
jgi:hypothetical protein